MGKRWAALAALAVVLVWAMAGGANAATVSQPVADGFAGPLQIAAELHAPTPSSVTQTTSGGDFMVDVFKALDIEYLAMN